ncbi:hypothetical protein [Paenarthrobacter aromaticivorans]|uniref:hypothetical protein n=1 Tax=Paenarthrobacter aromaticivorans TaxID=2849150 RepID=UPI003A8017EA
MKKRLLIILVAAVVVAGVVLVASLNFGPRPPSEALPQTDEGSSEPTSAAATGPVPAEVSDSISRFSSDPAGQIASASPFRSKAASSIPPGSKAVTVPETWDSGSDTTGSVAVDFTPAGRETKRYTALMVKEGGVWKVFATAEESQ